MMSRMKAIGVMVCLILICLLTGCGGSGGGSADTDYQEEEPFDVSQIDPSSIETFEFRDGDICSEDDKPVIRMFSASWCSHCQWVADAFDSVVEMYVEEGLIVAHHWDLDTKDDLLTDEDEQVVPDTEKAVYDEFGGGYPTFVFGCTYYRVGTAYEGTDDLEAEAAEFMAVIEALIAE